MGEVDIIIMLSIIFFEHKLSSQPTTSRITMKESTYHIVCITLLTLLMVPFGIYQFYNLQPWEEIPHTQTGVLGVFFFWTYICGYVFFASNILGGTGIVEDIGVAAVVSIFISTAAGLLWFNVMLLVSVISSGFELRNIASSNISQHFLWGSIVGAVFGIMILFIKFVPNKASNLRR